MHYDFNSGLAPCLGGISEGSGMARLVMVKLADGAHELLSEVQYLEKPLQELVRDHPDLLPVDEFGMQGPLVVVGRETSLPSGSIDLVAIARSGELLLVEFKTGPQNPDFRAVLGQLLDYGSDLWGMTLAQFEQGVAVRYFQSSHCTDPELRTCHELAAAFQRTWPDMDSAEQAAVLTRLEMQLSNGTFHFVVVAQRFTPTVERTIEYMNHQSGSSRFYAVELVAFEGGPLSAYEARALTKPPVTKEAATRLRQSVNEILAEIEPAEYVAALRDLVNAATALDLTFEVGAVGFSIRIRTKDRIEPLTVGWVFPPGRPGWLGLHDASFGFDSNNTARVPSIIVALQAYVEAISRIPGATPAKAAILKAFTIPPESLVRHHALIADAWAALAQAAAME